MFTAVILAAALTAAPGPSPSPTPDVRQIDQVEIVSAWGGMASGNYSDVIARRDGTRLFYGDKRVLSPRVAATLLAAIADAKPGLPTPEALGLTFEFAASHAPASRCSADADAIPAVTAWWARLFAKKINQRAFVSDYYGPGWFRTDDYPHVRATITLVNGRTISAESDGQQLFMLPFHLNYLGKAYDSYDPAIPRAIVAANPAAVNDARLQGYGIEKVYGDWLCGRNRNALTTEMLDQVAPAFARYARNRKLEFVDGGIKAGFSGIFGGVRFATWPIRADMLVDISTRPFDAQRFTTVVRSALDRYQATGDRILGTPWLARWLKTAKLPNIIMGLQTNSMQFGQDETLASVCSFGSVALVKDVADDKGAVYVGIADDSTTQYSEWVFLSDGRAILAVFDDRMTGGGPLGVALVSWPRYDAKDHARQALVVVSPQGKVLWAASPPAPK